MKTKLLIAIAAVILVGAVPQATPRGEGPGATSITSISSGFEFRAKSYHYGLNVDQLSSVPSWLTPEDGKPPLSLQAAIDASKRDLGRYNPTIAAWTLASVSMSPVGTSSKWYYTVSWRPKGSHIKDVFSVPVLMSGEAVPLQVRDAT